MSRFSSERCKHEKQALNPYLPLYEYMPDGEPRVFDGRLCVYGSHDEAGERINT